MRRIIVAARPGAVAPLKIALLPGAYQEPEDFLRAGFADVVAARGLALDLEFIAPELAHLLDRSVLDAILREVVLDARAAGCRAVWLGGASLGGFLALACAERHPGTLDGLCLFAPYLGNRGLTGEIARAGGLAAWQPGAIAAGDEERRVWAMLKARTAAPPALHLGLARQDRFGHGHALLAAALPPAAVDRIDGGHDFATWYRLWERFIDRLGREPALHGRGGRLIASGP